MSTGPDSLTAPTAPARERPPPARVAAWAILLAVPAAGFWLLIAAPALDIRWEHHPSHFWLVLAAGAVSAALAYSTGDSAYRRRDARLFLVSLALLSSAGFLGIHALATPGVLLAAPNAGFVIAVPVGLLLAGACAAASTIERPGFSDVVMRSARVLRLALLLVMAAWTAVSLAGLPPLDDPTPVEAASAPLVGVAVVGVGLFAYASAGYLARYRARPAMLLLAVVSAFVLLAEAMMAVAFARSWHATWWEWHLLMLAAFAVVAYGARAEGHEERYSALYLEETARGKREVSVLFADLQGFTTFSDSHDPREVSAMLNEYFEVAIPPVVREHGGDIDRVMGDAIMATFNTRGDQPDHAERAARAALAIRDATETLASGREGWPRFRVGVNTGEAMVGVVGGEGGRTYTVIGDTVNVASRLEGKAPVGGVAIGAETLRGLQGAETEPLGHVSVKGKPEGVEAYRLTGL
jgi:class 3 adenylate cyclase